MLSKSKHPTAGSTQGTCLIVEDSSFDQEKLRRILNRSFQDLHVVVAKDLAQAREVLDDQHVTLILLDNNLPDGDGGSFALELSKDPKKSMIPVVIVSDWPSPFMFHKAEQAGVRHVVSKSDFGARFVHSALKGAPGKRQRLA